MKYTEKIDDLEKELKEKDDSIAILESTLNNKTFENDKLKEDVKNLKKRLFPCIFCDYTFESEEDLSNHVRRMHDEKCNKCDLGFDDRRKLRDHICKVHLRNPARGNCYMKNWIVTNGCTPIYNKATMTEIATLHCDDC